MPMQSAMASWGNLRDLSRYSGSTPAHAGCRDRDDVGDS